MKNVRMLDQDRHRDWHTGMMTLDLNNNVNSETRLVVRRLIESTLKCVTIYRDGFLMSSARDHQKPQGKFHHLSVHHHMMITGVLEFFRQ